MRETKSFTEVLNDIPSPPTPLPQVGEGCFASPLGGEAARSVGEGAGWLRRGLSSLYRHQYRITP